MSNRYRPLTAAGDKRASPYAEDLSPVERIFADEMRSWMYAVRFCPSCKQDKPVDLFGTRDKCLPCESERIHEGGQHASFARIQYYARLG